MAKNNLTLLFGLAGMKSWKLTFGVIFVLCLLGILYSGYFLHGRNTERTVQAVYKSNFEAYFAGRFLQNKFTEKELNKDYNLDLENEDVIVFLHIQKTGGSTFGKHLVQNLDVDSPCNCPRARRMKKRCNCLTKTRQVWLFSRFSTGWKCGLHADWTELTACVDDWFQTNNGTKKRRYHYITLLRDPVARFVSEWMHVQRGATWKAATLRCNGRQATLKEVPFCFSSKNWKGVTLKEFMECQHNLAFNRQTRMLANLSQVSCYSPAGITSSQRDQLMLDSAKQNLLNMAFFGLVEFQTYTQFLFEHTLNINFIEDFVQHNSTHSSTYDLTAEELKQIAEMNHLDIELYQFAKDLFLQRVTQAFVDEDIPVPGQLKRLVVKANEERNRSTKQSTLSVLEENKNMQNWQNIGQENTGKDVIRKRFISSHPIPAKGSADASASDALSFPKNLPLYDEERAYRFIQHEIKDKHTRFRADLESRSGTGHESHIEHHDAGRVLDEALPWLRDTGSLYRQGHSKS